ncbi:MAG: thermonuclease family protein [Clostridiales bacterium]|nr:thermonuclease family protein [Clostridiales bacterium]
MKSSPLFPEIKPVRAHRAMRKFGIAVTVISLLTWSLSGCSFSTEDLIDALNQLSAGMTSVADAPDDSDILDDDESVQDASLTADAPVTEPFTVVRVVDGDTIWVEDDQGEQYKIRIIGVDAPETEKEDQEGEPFAEEAYAFAKETLSDRVVYLERDVSDTDQYGRLLRYVWLGEPAGGDQETFERLNFSAILVRGGYARVVAYGEDTRYESELRALEKLARGDRLGMWAYS